MRIVPENDGDCVRRFYNVSIFFSKEEGESLALALHEYLADREICDRAIISMEDDFLTIGCSADDYNTKTEFVKAVCRGKRKFLQVTS